MQIIYFEFKEFHVPFKTLQSIFLKFFAKKMKGNCIFCCSSCISFNPTNHPKSFKKTFNSKHRARLKIESQRYRNTKNENTER